MTLPHKSCYRQRCEKVRNPNSRQNGENRQDSFPHLVELNTIGERLVYAFRERYGTEDVNFIAEKLGYKTGKAIYRIINGERELSFERLRMFKNSTFRSIDWLLNGEETSSPAAINPAAFSANERVFIEMLATHHGISFTAVVKQLVGVGLDERARHLAGNYKRMSEEELREMLDAALANEVPSEEDNSGKKKEPLVKVPKSC